MYVCLLIYTNYIKHDTKTTMSDKYSKLILTELLLVQAVILCLFVGGDVATDKGTIIEDDGVIKTIVRRDQFKREWVEYAFHVPKKGLPVHLLELFCSSVKLRLYWKGFRRQVKQTHRKGIYLRRMARFAKHVFKDVRDVDKPFNATMLSKVDKHFMAEFDQSKSSPYDDYDDDDNFDHDEDGQPDDSILRPKKTKMGFKGRVKKMMHVLHKPKHSDSVSDEIIEEIESNETAKKLTKFASKSLKHAALFLYTRWRVMWWLTLSCLYTKYYLWDPALDEFIKLKRSLLTWPDLQLVKLQDLRCKPIRFFMRIMDICKILNPLMKVDLGQFNYDSLTRFKNDSK